MAPSQIVPFFCSRIFKPPTPSWSNTHKRNPQVELVLVMIVAPTVLNAVQFWVGIYVWSQTAIFHVLALFK